MCLYEVQLKQVSLSFPSRLILGQDPIVHSIRGNYAFQFSLLVNPMLDNILSYSTLFLINVPLSLYRLPIIIIIKR